MRRTLVLLLTAATIVATAQGAQAKPKYTVTASVSKTQLDVGQKVTISGLVTPTAKGKKVTIQRRYGSGSWKSITTDTISSSGTYSKSIKPTKASPTSYRVVKAGSSSRSSGTSPTRKVGVFRWRNLIDLPVFRRSVVGTAEGKAIMLGTTYTSSLLIGGTDAFIAYRTDKLCDDLEMKIGIDQQSLPDSGSSGTATISTYANDGVEYPAPIFTQSLVFKAPVTYFRPTSSMASLPYGLLFGFDGPTNRVVAAFGSPRVHCMS